MSGVRLQGLVRQQQRFARASRGRVKAGPVDAEHAQQLQRVRGMIPYDSGDTERAMTDTNDGARKVSTDGRVVRIAIHTRGAYWQADGLPRLIDTSAMARVAVGTIYMEG